MNQTNDGLHRLMMGRRGHFLLESGYHTDLWLTLDALFVQPRSVAPHVTKLAEQLRPHNPTAICGPLLGGAFLAQALATTLGVDFYFTEPVTNPNPTGLFSAAYRLPPALAAHANGARVAIVDDVISAGSSVRATANALGAVHASIVAVGTLLLLGTVARDHFALLGIPLEALTQQDFPLWRPDLCPMCQSGVALENPLSGLV